MTLTPDQQKETLEMVMQYFSRKEVAEMDDLFLDFDDMRVASKGALEFIAKVKEKYPENYHVFVAAILYGVKLGELGYDYQTKELPDKKLPDWGHAC